MDVVILVENVVSTDVVDINVSAGMIVLYNMGETNLASPCTVILSHITEKAPPIYA